MKLTEMYPSKYLKVDDLEGDSPVIIANIKFERMQDDEGKEEDKPVLYFLKVAKGLVLNKTNATTIAEQLGDETEAWAGKRIVLIKENVTAFGKKQWAIRVRSTPPPPSGSGALKDALAEAGAADPADSFGGAGT